MIKGYTMDKDIIAHPSTFISEELSDSIRLKALEAEQFKALHPAQLEVIFSQRWFKMMVPEAYGGIELSLPEVLRIEEGLSYADGSTGWVVTLCSGAAWFSGFIERSLLEEIFRDEKVCFAGSGAPTGTAKRNRHGYEINGFWKYASGSPHATIFTANCLIEEDGIIQLENDGSPQIRPFFFHKDEVTLRRDWNAMGMVATGTHAFGVERMNVPAHRCFRIDPNHVTLDHPVYLFPFLQLAETTLSVNLSGMAMRFLDLCAPIFSQNMRRAPRGIHGLEETLVAAKAELNGCRWRFYDVVERSWRSCEKREGIARAVLDEVSSASYALAYKSLNLVDGLFRFCGLGAADTRQEINRVWRNIHTAGQHGLFNWK
jgi:alkylation response protein AidB-like acyl-CoA dehydrogenase